MGRKQKHPEHVQRAQELMNELLDWVVALWTAEDEPELKAIAEAIELSPAKLRKLLITAGERDHTPYYTSAKADYILSLYHSGLTVKEIIKRPV